MKLHLLGVRGSTPAPGSAFLRYGGHTSCVAITAADESEPTLVLDAGTGIRNLNRLLPTGAFRGAILLTHLHWDHVQGLPFAPCLDRPDSQVDLRLPAQGWRDARGLLGRCMSPPSFPIQAKGLRGRWRVRRLQPGTQRIGAFTVTAAEVPHKGGRTFGYRVEADGAAVAYLPDHALAKSPRPPVRQLVQDVDLMLHDASNAVGERAAATAFGHSTVDDAVRFAESAHARELVLTHHAPQRTDDQLDVITATLEPSTVKVRVAREGSVLDVGYPTWRAGDPRPPVYTARRDRPSWTRDYLSGAQSGSGAPSPSPAGHARRDV
jgi:phosphoribosyl 1,2-cyclic phosphodiesterase